MKKLYLLISVFMVSVLGLAAMAWAQEASFFDDVENWIIRAYVEGSAPPYIVKIEVRDTGNVLIPGGNIVGLTANPATVANATTPDVSLSFDAINATAYVFYTTSAGVQMEAFPNIVSTSGPCITVNPATTLPFGSVNVGSASDRTVTVSNTGTSNLGLGTLSVTGTGFSRQGGTCVNGQTVAPQASCTVIVRFAPVSAGSVSGNLSIPSDDRNVDVSLSGTGSITNGNIDLTITSLSSWKSADNNSAFPVSVTVANRGSSSAGAFTVKGYFSRDQIPNNGGLPADYLLFTWDVPGLGAGASLSNSFSVAFSGFPIHSGYYVVVKVDADDAIAEGNEGNNIATKAVYVSR